MSAHVVLDLPPNYAGGKPGRRCCVCHLSESLCVKFPDCSGHARHSVNAADQKSESRRRKRLKQRR